MKLKISLRQLIKINMTEHRFTGFGFGPIQAGLFVNEACKSGNFSEITIAEIDQKLVDAVRNNKGCFNVNIAASNEIKSENIKGIVIYNPNNKEDLKKLICALSEST